MQALAPGVSWWYNWSPAPEAAVQSTYRAAGVNFVPLVWNGNFSVPQLVANIPAGAGYLLGFNEPNFKDQANMTPSEAAAKWPALTYVAQQRGLLLGSPAVNYCGNCVAENGVTYTDPVAYLDAFFAACPACQVDFIAVHWYACDLGALQSYIGRFKKYGKPIWLTEFACGDLPAGQITVARQKSYLSAAVAYLESEPAVARYAWFSGRTGAIPNANLLGDSGQLTELGQLYVGLPAAVVTAAAPAAPAPVLNVLTDPASAAPTVAVPALAATAATYSVVLSDLAGRTVCAADCAGRQLVAGYRLPLAGALPAGVYVLRVRGAGLALTRKLLFR